MMFVRRALRGRGGLNTTPDKVSWYEVDGECDDCIDVRDESVAASFAAWWERTHPIETIDGVA